MPYLETVALNSGRKPLAESIGNSDRLLERRVQHWRNQGVDWVDALVETLRKPDYRVGATMRSITENGARVRALETQTLAALASVVDLTTLNVAFDDYEQYAAAYEAFAEIHSSTQAEEEYPEDFDDDLPQKISDLQEAPESRTQGQSYRIRNFMYARKLAISKNAFENDNRGIIKQRAGRFGRNFKKVIDRNAINGLFRQTTPANPYMPATNFLGNGLVQSGFGKISPQRIEDAFILTGVIKDPFDEFLVVDFNTLVCDTTDRLKAKRFLNSMYSPTGNSSSSTGYDADQSPGPFTENILNGLLQVIYSPYVKTARAPLSNPGQGMPALLMEAKRGYVVQIRKEFTITMENPDAGRSFDTASFNWRGDMSFGTGLRNPRCFVVIN